MAYYDDVIERNKRYLTNAQVNALVAASQEYNIQNAGNRAGALASAREQYDTGYRGLQNMGLAGAMSGAPTSGEVPRLQTQIQAPFDAYNNRLRQVENQRLNAMGGMMAEQTRQARAAAAQQAAIDQLRAAEDEIVNRVKATKQQVAVDAANKYQQDGAKRTAAVKQITVDAANKYQTDGAKRTAALKQAQTQQAAQVRDFRTASNPEVTTQDQMAVRAAAEVLGVGNKNTTTQSTGFFKKNGAVKQTETKQTAPQKTEEQKAEDTRQSFVLNPVKIDRATMQSLAGTPAQRQQKIVYTQSANVLNTGKGYDTDADQQALAEAQNTLDNMKWRQHYGGKVDSTDYKNAQDQVEILKLKVEHPDLYAALVVYNNEDARNTPEYDKAADVIAKEEAKALVKQVYGRDIDTSMTFDEYENAGKNLKEIKRLVARLDYAEKTLDVAKKNKMLPETIAEDQALVDSTISDIENLGYTVDQARNLATNYAQERDVRTELEYYTNAFKADMLYSGKMPIQDINDEETDVTYRAVNNLPDLMREKKNWWDYLPGSMANSALTDQALSLGGVWGQWMTQDQKNAYNYLYDTKGIKAANEYLDSIRPLINIQHAQEDAEYAKELVNDSVGSAILANLESIPIRAAGSIPAALEKLVVGGLNAASDLVTGGTGSKYYIDTNSPANQLANYASTIRSETSQRIIEENQDNPTLANWANRAYQIGMSTADSAFNMAFGVAGAPWMTGMLAGSDAANEAYKDARARGGTQEQALAVAGLSGIAENLFERISLEYFTNQWIEKGAAWTRPFIVKWGLGAGVEGSEEVATSIANLLSDVYVMHDKSEWQNLVDEKGIKGAVLDEIKSIGWEGLAGAISGGVFGLFGGAFNAATNYADTTNIGKKAESLGLVQKYEDMATVLGGKAEKSAAKVELKPTAHNVGSMVNQVNKLLSETFTGNEQNDIPMALLFSGKQLSFTEANDVYQALGSEKLENMGYESDSVRSFMESYNKRMADAGIFARMQEQLKESQKNTPSAEAEEYLTMTDQLGGTEYNEKNIAQNKAMREALEKRVWKNPNVGTVTTYDGTEVASMPGNMSRVAWAEMNRKNFRAQSTVTNGRATYELSSMAMRDGMTNEQAYAAMRENMQDAAKKSADFYENIANSLGLDIVIHDVMRGSNGFLKDGKLHVVLSSRQNAVRIASHELTHYIKAHSPEKFTKLQQHLIGEVGNNEFNRMVANKAALYGFDTKTQSGLANAREEVCAELCERMLSNDQMLSRFAQRETDTARAMKSHLEKTVDAIHKALTGNDQRDFGNSDSKLIKAEKTLDSWIDGLTDAIANAEAQKNTMEGQIASVAGVTVADQTNLVSDLSEAENDDDLDEVYNAFSVDVIEYDMAGYMQDLADAGVMTAKEIDDLYDTMNAAINTVKAHRAILDYGTELTTEEEIQEAKRGRAYMPYKQNADPHYKLALDFSTLCRKRVLLQTIQERLQAKLGRALSQEETVAVRLELQKLQREGYKVEVACALCYVEAARLKSQKVINTFLNNTEAEMRNYFAQKNPASKNIILGMQQQWKVDHGYAPDTTKKQMSSADVAAFNTYSRSIREQFESDHPAEQVTIQRAIDLANDKRVMVGGITFPGRETFLSASWLTKLKSVEPDIFNAFTDKVRSATRSKAQETDTFYSRGDIDMVTESILNYANAESGFRHQSWSDFVPTHLLDTMAAVIEMSTRNGKMHAYTKVPSMVEFLGKSGMMLNMSLIPAGDTGLNVDGSLAFDPVEGMPWDTMMRLRDMFPDTAGNIAIGIGDEQIKKLLDSNDVDYVIPYHASGMNKNMRGYMDIRAWSEFTSSQNEKTNHRGQKGAAPELAEWFDENSAKKAKDGYAFMREASEKYLQLCYERNLTPKFSQYLQNKGDGSYSLKEGYENYWKLLIDRKMVNQKTGGIIIQQAVKPVFDKTTVLGILEDRINDPSIQDAAEAADIVTEKFSGWQANKNNADAEAIQEAKNIRDRTAAITAQKTAEAMHSIDEETSEPAQYSAETIEQLEGVSEFLDQITKGDQQLREKLISALMPVIEQKVATAEKLANKPVRTAQNGMKPAGRQPRVRDVQVPQYAKTGNPVSDFARSFLESDKATDEMVADLQEKIENGEWGSYARLTNKEAMDQAKDFISRRTLSKAQEEFHDMVKSGRYNVGTRAIGLQLLAEAAQRGDQEAVLNIATDLRELATDAGQSVQIFNVLKGLGGFGSAWYMQKKIDALNTKYADQIAAGKMNEITVDPGLMQDLMEAKTTAEVEAAEDEIAKEIARQLPLTWASRISNWRYLAMLGNPTTHFRNITGNVFMAGLNTTKDAVASGIERLAVKDTGKRAHALLTMKDRQTWDRFAEQSYKDQEKALRGNGKFGFETQLRQYMRSFDTKWLNKIAQFNFDKLEQEDMWFIKPAYQNALMQYMKAQGFQMKDGVAGKMVDGKFKEATTEQMNAAREWASQQAWKATFHDASVVADMLNNASRKLGPVGNVLIEGVMPFKKTPINIAKRGIEYSPAGIIMGAVQLMKDVNSGKVTTAQAIDNIASGITGTALMALGAFLAKLGLLRSGGDDKKKKETYLTDTGDQTYSLKLGKYSIGLSALAPATIPLFMGAALYDALDRNGEGLDLSAATETVANALNPFMEMSFMSSLNSALKNYNQNGIGGALGNTLLTAAESYGSQFLPTAVGKVGQFFDPTVRSAKSSAASPVGSNLDYYARSLAKKVPGLEATLQPDVNVWGRTTEKDSFQKWALDFANKFIFPAYVKVAQKDKVDDELIRVVESTGDVDVLPSDGPKYFTSKGEKYPMTAAQYTEYSQERGQASYAALKETMSADAYWDATDEEKANMLSNALGAAQKTVDTAWKEKLGAVEEENPENPKTEVQATKGEYSDPALYKVAASYPKAYDKAAKANAKGISPDAFLDLYEKKDTYSGDDLSTYTREEIMKSDLTPKQKEFMDDLIVSDKGWNPDYSSQAWFEASMLGNDSKTRQKHYEEAKEGAKIGLKPETYVQVYNKWKSLSGNTKQHDAKAYLDSLTITAPVYDYLWYTVFGYTKHPSQVK